MTDAAGDTDTYALKSDTLPEVAAPELAYLPPMPKTYRPKIGLIGTGGISASHLDAYQTARWDVAALWNRTRSKAEEKAAQYCPTARVEDDWRAIFANSDIDVVDITLHPEHRAPIIKAALKAGKHVLSQKPFVTDLDLGKDLCDLADDSGVKLAVNQNGRWAPHLSWMRAAQRAGHIGDVLTAHVNIHWDHRWTAGTPFDQVDDLVLLDFGVHWFDFITSLIGDRAESVFATTARAQGQPSNSPLLAQTLVKMEGGQASLVFDGGVPFGPRDTTYVGGTMGSLQSDGPDLGAQSVTLTTQTSVSRPNLQGKWFNDGFRGAMGALLCAIENDETPENAARENLNTLALAFAAVRSRITGREITVGEARRLER